MKVLNIAMTSIAVVMVLLMSSKGNSLAASTQGETVYKQNCKSCHGVDGKGTKKGASLTGDAFKRKIDGNERGYIVQIVRKGCKSQKNLSQSESDSLTEYIMHLK